MVPILLDGGLTAAIIVSLVIAATSIVLSELLRPKPKLENARPAGIGDFNFPTATEGRPVPIFWGTVRISGPNVVWYGDLRQTKITKKVKTGLWSSKNIVTNFKYFVGIQMGLCRGPIGALRQIWIGDVAVFSGTVTSGPIVISKPELFGGDDYGGGGIDGTLRLHEGSETQAVNAYLTAFQSPQPAYRGTCYVVWEGGYIGNSTAIKPWAFELERFPNGLALTDGKHIVNSKDANPAAVLYELLTDTDWGFGFLPSKIDAVSLRAAGDTLHAEGNGFSMLLDRGIQARELKAEIERQIDGVLFLDQETGLWKINLIRGGYDIDTIPQLTAANIKSVEHFARATWKETVNQVRVKFNNRDKLYAEDFGQAHDLANQRVQGGELIPLELTFPGIKNKDLAQQIASRALRALSIPIARARLVVDRSQWNLKPGNVVAWTDPNLNFTKLPMRVASIDFGTMLDGQIELALIQDTFFFSAGFFGAPENTGWTAPNQNVDPFVHQRAIEAPWALVRRDTDHPGIMDRIFAAGRAVTGKEISFRIWQRNAAGSPSGAFAEAGEVFAFALVGQLRTAITAGTANPMTVSMNGTPDTLTLLQAAFTPSPSAGDIGQNLVNLLLIDDEFIAPTTIVNQTTHLDLQSTYRGMLDSAPVGHAVNANIFLVFVGSGLSAGTITPNNNVDVKLRPRSRTDEVAENEATTIAFQMQNRARRPYPPTQLKMNTVLYPTSVDFDTMRSGGTTLDDRGIDSAYTRRDYRNLDEVDGILRDAAVISSDFPANNANKYKAKIIKDPAGTPVTLFETAFNTGAASIFLSRTKILRNNAGVKPANVRVEITARHDFEGVTYDALQVLSFDVAIGASTLDNDTNMGVLAQNVVGAVYTAPTTGTYTFNLGVALASGAVDARINGGAFATVIAAGNTTGTLAGIVATDTIEVRHTQAGGANTETFLEVDAPSSSVDAYAILTY